MNELDELRLDAYKNAKIYKEKTKRWHKELSEEIWDLVLLFQFPTKTLFGKTEVEMDGTVPNHSCTSAWSGDYR